MIAKKDIIYIINPLAQEGRALHLWQMIRKKKKYAYLPENPVNIVDENITLLIQKKKPKLIVVAGGDGAINSICKVVSQLKHKPILGIIPLGTGNGLSYCLGVETINKALDVINNQYDNVTIDLMTTNIKNHERAIINTSVGIDARIVLHRQDYRYIGWGAYFVSAFRSFFLHPEEDITFTIDHKVTLSARASSLFIANAPVIGLNYLVSPHAKLNDGLLDCTLFSTKYAQFRNLRYRGFKHPLYTELGKVCFKASHIRIEGNSFVQIDGDPVTHQGAIEIGISPSQVTFLRNKEKAIDYETLPFHL